MNTLLIARANRALWKKELSWWSGKLMAEQHALQTMTVRKYPACEIKSQTLKITKTKINCLIYNALSNEN